MNDVRDLSFEAMLPFYQTLAEAVKPFRSSYGLRGANVDGCRVMAGKGRKRGQRKFMWLDKRHQLVELTIDLAELARDPKQYLGELLEFIDQAMIRAKKDMPNIIVPGAIAS